MANLKLSIQRNVVLFMECWLTYHVRHFEDDNDEQTNELLTEFITEIFQSETLKRIQNARTITITAFSGFARSLLPQLWRCHSQIEDGNRVSKKASRANSNIFLIQFSTNKIELLQYIDQFMEDVENNNLSNSTSDKTISKYSAMEIAQQITLVLHVIFSEIPLDEFKNKRFSKGKDIAPYFNKLKFISNQINLNLLNEILKFNDMNARANVIRLFVNCADICLKLSNCDSVVSILSILGNSSVFRFCHNNNIKIQ